MFKTHNCICMVLRTNVGEVYYLQSILDWGTHHFLVLSTPGHDLLMHCHKFHNEMLFHHYLNQSIGPRIH